MLFGFIAYNRVLALFLILIGRCITDFVHI